MNQVLFSLFTKYYHTLMELLDQRCYFYAVFYCASRRYPFALTASKGPLLRLAEICYENMKTDSWLLIKCFRNFFIYFLLSLYYGTIFCKALDGYSEDDFGFC